jgi:hypothetical protein
MRYTVTITMNKDMSEAALRELIKTMLMRKFYPEFIATSVHVTKENKENN